MDHILVDHAIRARQAGRRDDRGGLLLDCSPHLFDPGTGVPESRCAGQQIFGRSSPNRPAPKASERRLGGSKTWSIRFRWQDTADRRGLGAARPIGLTT
jgi:hypothetical protein